MNPWLVLRPKSIPFSLRVDRRVPGMVVLFVLGTLIGMVINIGVGEYPIAPLDVIKTVLGLDTGNPAHAFIVMTLRLPRMIVAWLVGVALGAAGGLVQSIARNPLASPDLTGVTAGASLAAVILMIGFPDVPFEMVPFAAFAGGMIAAALLYALAWRNTQTGGDSSPIRLILVGIGLSAVLGAVISFMLTFGDIWQVERAMRWLTGSVYAANWEDVRTLVPWLVVCLPFAILNARDLNALNLGEDVALELGARVTLQRGFLLLLAVAMCGAVVTVAGAIGFVGLVAPHLARRLVGPMHEGALPLAAVIGGLIVVLSDLIGRAIVAPAEIPAGIIIALVGAPFFMYLLYLNRNR
jgi:iron complex transport system permease protein